MYKQKSSRGDRGNLLQSIRKGCTQSNGRRGSLRGGGGVHQTRFYNVLRKFVMNKLQNGVSQYASMLTQRGDISSAEIMFERAELFCSGRILLTPFRKPRTDIFFIWRTGETSTILTVRLRWCGDLFALRRVCC